MPGAGGVAEPGNSVWLLRNSYLPAAIQVTSAALITRKTLHAMHKDVRISDGGSRILRVLDPQNLSAEILVPIFHVGLQKNCHRVCRLRRLTLSHT